MKRSEALQQRKDLLKLIEQWTRAEVMARLGRFDNLEFADYARIEIEKRDEIRRLLFDTDSLVVLGERWGMLKSRQREKKCSKKSK